MCTFYEAIAVVKHIVLLKYSMCPFCEAIAVIKHIVLRKYSKLYVYIL